MTSENTPGQNLHDPVSELGKCLLRTHSDSDRLKAYLQFLPEITLISPTEAVSIATNACRIAIGLRDWQVCMEIFRLRADAHLQLGNAAAALEDLHEAHAQMEGIHDAAAPRIFLAMGAAHMMLGDSGTAREWMEKALERCVPGADPVRGDVLEALADVLLSAGNYDEAIGALRELQAIREELGDSSGIGRAFCSIGTAYGKMNDQTKAYECHQLSLPYFQESGDISNAVRALANMAGIHRSRGELNAAIETALKARAACEGSGDWRTIAHLTITIADIHREQEELDVALETYVKAFDFLQRYPADDLLLGLYQRVGRLHEDTADLAAAKHVYRQALQIAEKIGERRSQVAFHHAISGVYERQGNYQEALWHYKEFATLQYSLSGEEQQHRIAEMQMKYDMIRIEQERDSARLRASQLEEHMEMKERELMKTNIALTETSTKLEKVTQKVERLRDAEAGPGNRAMDDLFREVSKHESRAASGPPETQQEWERLKRQLDKLYPDFERTLFERCRDLTPTEMKLCVLTKLLGEDTAQIARILDNTHRTVQTQRASIRKKLGLPKEVHFPTFIQTL